MLSSRTFSDLSGGQWTVEQLENGIAEFRNAAGEYYRAQVQSGKIGKMTEGELRHLLQTLRSDSTRSR